MTATTIQGNFYLGDLRNFHAGGHTEGLLPLYGLAFCWHLGQLLVHVVGNIHKLRHPSTGYFNARRDYIIFC